METMNRLEFILSGLALILAACSAPPVLPSTPERVETVTPVVYFPSPAYTPTTTPTSTPPAFEGPFTKISRSTDNLHLKCDPLEIIFDVTVNFDKIRSVVFFF